MLPAFFGRLLCKRFLTMGLRVIPGNIQGLQMNLSSDGSVTETEMELGKMITAKERQRIQVESF